MNTEWDVERKEGKDFEAMEIPPEGAIPARICAVLDVGTHDARSMKGDLYERRVVILGYELGELDSGGSPFYMAKTDTLSLDTKSNLYKVVKAIAGEQPLGAKFNPGWIAGQPCLLQVSYDRKVKQGKERVYANIDSVGRPPRGTVTPKGNCVVWRIADMLAVPLPAALDRLPKMWHEGMGKMFSVFEWVQNSREVAGADRDATAAGPIRDRDHPHSRTTAAPLTQQEADSIPF